MKIEEIKLADGKWLQAWKCVLDDKGYERRTLRKKKEEHCLKNILSHKTMIIIERKRKDRAKYLKVQAC